MNGELNVQVTGVILFVTILVSGLSLPCSRLCCLAVFPPQAALAEADGGASASSRRVPRHRSGDGRPLRQRMRLRVRAYNPQVGCR